MATVAILGAGQLGRMLALAGYPLGLSFRFLDLRPDAPGAKLGSYVQAKTFLEEKALTQLIQDAEVVTFEFENVPVEAVRFIEKTIPVFPSSRALEVAQDRLSEKQLFAQLGIETPKFHAIDSEEDLWRAVEVVGLPAVIKTRRFGYDGKGQHRVQNEEQVKQAWASLKGNALIYESFVAFDRELSVVAVRSRTGEIAWYPLTQNTHEEGILRVSIAPAPGIPDVLEQTARGYCSKILRELDYVGVLALELFQVNGKLLANELAPRVHNSGHWTIDGAETSQFENHLRAILGLPLGSAVARGFSGMINLLGSVPSLQEILAISHAHLHLYGKSAAEKRKMGHITFTAETYPQLERLLEALPPALR